MSLGDLEAKWSAFGWATARVDGHDLGAMDRAILSTLAAGAAAGTAMGRPVLIVLDTLKGKGVPALEGRAESHNAPFGPADLAAALAAVAGEASHG